MDRKELNTQLAKALAYKDTGNYKKVDEHARALVEGLRALGFQI